MILKQCKTSLVLVTLLLLASPALAESTLSVGQTTKLIRAAEKNVRDANGWAIDLHDVLDAHDLAASKENICAAIAIIDQESSFEADPQVPGLGKLSEAALRKKLFKIPVGGALALAWLEKNPTAEESFMARIRNAKTERDLDLAYRSLVEFGARSSNLDAVFRLGLLNQLIENKNEIDTAGSMQVSVNFALEEAKIQKWLPMTLDDVYAVRDQLYTRRGGMFYGVKQLMGYDTGYAQKIFRFADFNAGRYAARNAAFQKLLSEMSGETLAADGDLLSYGKDGKAQSRVTASEQAVQKASLKHKLGLDDKQIRADLVREKQLGFTGTRTFIALRQRYQSVRGKRAAFAVLPEIELKSEKLSRIYSTRRFAESVNKRYQACVALK